MLKERKELSVLLEKCFIQNQTETDYSDKLYREQVVAG